MRALVPEDEGRRLPIVRGLIARLYSSRRTFKNIEPELRAYLAGLLDGEGCIQIQQPHHGGKHRSGWALVVTIGVTSGELMGLYAEAGRPGSMSLQERPPHKPMFSWRMSGRAAEWFLRAVQPYLRIKAPHAKVGLAFRATIKSRNGRGRCAPTAEILVEREHLHVELRKLNA
jgi:hypothetical protein